jgi:peptide/nickel transport system substrate-binding protein
MWKPYQNFGSLLHRKLTAVDTPDQHTAIFRYAEPMPLPLLLRAAAELCYVVPRHVFENTDLLNNPANTRPIGTGPYRFVDYKPGQYVVMERNPTYWAEGLPYLDRVVVRVIGDAASASAALEAGEIDISVFSSLPRADLARLATTPGFRVSTKGNEANVINNTLGFNMRRRELADLRVRQALAHALDLEFYSDNFLYGYGKRAFGPIPSTSGFYTPGAAPDYPFDPKRADALLDQAGLPAGPDGTRLSFKLMPNTSDDIHMLGTFMQQSWAKIGVQTEIVIYDSPGYNTNVNRNWNFDLATDTGTFRGDPAVGSTLWYHSGIAPGTPWSNQWGYSSPQMDGITDSAAVELDDAKRHTLYADFARLANTDLPVWMALEQLFVSAVADHVRNDHNNPRWPSSHWADVWLAS